MRLLTKTLPDDHNLFLFGDSHDGNVLRVESGWQKLLDMMNSYSYGLPPSANFGIDHGDMMEAIMIDDPRYHPATTTTPFPNEQKKSAIRDREPIKNKLLFILEGNHEFKLWRFGNITEEICHDYLRVPYGTYTTKLTVLDRKGGLMYKHFATHGRKMINSAADDPKRRKANMELTLKRQLKFKAGDCAVMSKGHTHKLLVCDPEPELYLTDNGKEIEHHYTESPQNAPFIHPDHRWFINTGSFLKLYGEDGISGYAERAEYDPLETGFPVLIVRDRKIQGVEKVYV